MDLRLSVPPSWHADVAYGGLGADPFGVSEIILANFRLPASTTGCGALIPTLSRRRVMIRIYDYGSGPLAPTSPRAQVIRLNGITPVRDRVSRARGFSEARLHLGGDALLVQGLFGARRPPAFVLRTVRRVLASARVRTSTLGAER